MTDEQFKKLKSLVRLNNPNLYLLNVKDTALVLSISPKAVKKIIEKGHLDATLYGNKNMITSTDLNEFIANLDGRSLSEFM